MSGKVTAEAYVEIIDENIEWIESKSDKCLISRHIVEVMKGSILSYYGKTYDEVKDETS